MFRVMRNICSLCLMSKAVALSSCVEKLKTLLGQVRHNEMSFSSVLFCFLCVVLIFKRQ